MSKIPKLKTWLPIEDAAARLSLLTDEPVLPRDLIQFAIEGHVSLSLYLFSPVLACCAEVIETPRELFGREVEYIPTKEQVIEAGERISYQVPPTIITVYPDKGHRLSGLVDVATNTATETYRSLYTLTDTGTSDEMRPYLYVEQDGGLYELREQVYTPDGFGAGTVEARHIPEGAKLVIRVSELNRLEAELGGKPLDSRERAAYNNLVGALLDTVLNGKRWGEPVSTFADQEDVIKYLTENYQDCYGIAKRSLEGKFAAANEAIKGQ